MKQLFFILTLILSSSIAYSQCESININRENWTVIDFDTQETSGEGANNGLASDAIDENISTYWHSQWQNIDSEYPHYISVDMGDIYPINGMSVKSRGNVASAKSKKYELYLSMDGNDWELAQSAGDFMYSDLNVAGAAAAIEFGAVEARYFKLVILSNYDNNPHIAIAEIQATQIDGSEGCTATGQNNQVINLDDIPKHYTEDADFALEGVANSGLPVFYEIIEGPAMVSGNTLSLTGDGGIVEVRAYNDGDADYYPVETFRTFQVVDLSLIQPEIFTRVTDAVPVEMPELRPYLLTASSEIEEEDTLSISQMQFFVNGMALETTAQAASYQAWWTPSEYGTHSIEIKSTASNGSTTTLTKNVDVVNSNSTQDVVTLEDAVIDFGTIGSQWYYGSYTLPQSVGAYSKITANFDVSCPNVPGGCDDWDRLAWVQIKDPNGQWIELFRYITPYGVGCNHSIDVTDYESLLQGEIEMRAYIETWGTGGWKLDLSLEYEQGTPEYIYTKVQEAWQGNYSFGDPLNQQPVPKKTFITPENTAHIDFRLVTTGHGWGANNTANAAEFYFPTHDLKVNGENTFTQYLKTDCSPNPDNCTGQQGTWSYDRAGWCPGTIPSPYFYDLSDLAGSTFDFEYKFFNSYLDFCHPNNPNCITGITCSDCNDGYNPYYRVGSYMIYKGNEPLGASSVTAIDNIIENEFEVYPNPNNGVFKVQLERKMQDIIVQIYNVAGKSLKTYFFKNKSELAGHNFDLSNIGAGVYFAKIYNGKQTLSQKIVVK